MPNRITIHRWRALEDPCKFAQTLAAAKEKARPLCEGEKHSYAAVNTGFVEWFTPPAYLKPVRAVLVTSNSGMYGSFHSVSEAHLGRYLAEFDFRYNNRKATDAECMGDGYRFRNSRAEFRVHAYPYGRLAIFHGPRCLLAFGPSKETVESFGAAT